MTNVNDKIVKILQCKFKESPLLKRPGSVQEFHVDEFIDGRNGSALLVNNKFIVINEEVYVPMENVVSFKVKPL